MCVHPAHGAGAVGCVDGGETRPSAGKHCVIAASPIAVAALHPRLSLPPNRVSPSSPWQSRTFLIGKARPAGGCSASLPQPSLHACMHLSFSQSNSQPLNMTSATKLADLAHRTFILGVFGATGTEQTPPLLDGLIPSANLITGIGKAESGASFTLLIKQSSLFIPQFTSE